MRTPEADAVAPTWNPRFLAYCAVRRRLPGDIMPVEGSMAGFMAWIDRQWSDWCRERGRPRHDGKTDADHKAFDWWLSRRLR